MVWIIKIILFNILFISQNLYSNNLNQDEEMFYNFMDFNNDNQISLSEIERSINIVFQLVDLNQDGFISKSEVSELKEIVDSLK